LETAVQGYENVRGRRDGYDLGNIAEAGAKGAVSGTVKGAVSGTVKGALNGVVGIDKWNDPRNALTGLVGSGAQSATVGANRATGFIVDEALSVTGLDDTLADLGGRPGDG
jgi:hypothetical protein